MATIGKVLWWDRRDKEGIIVDGAGNQYFFNHSVTAAASLSKLDDGQYVEFDTSNLVPHVSCAKNVVVISQRSQKRAEQTFIEQKQLSLGGI